MNPRNSGVKVRNERIERKSDVNRFRKFACLSTIPYSRSSAVAILGGRFFHLVRLAVLIAAAWTFLAIPKEAFA